jgi:hypothetical protein
MYEDANEQVPNPVPAGWVPTVWRASDLPELKGLAPHGR